MSDPKNDADLPGLAVPAIPAIPSGPAAPTTADPSPGVAEADRLIAAALADHVRMPAPARLRAQLAQRHLAPRRPWRAWLPAFALGAASAAAVALLVVRPAAPADVAMLDEAVGDHQRIISAPRQLDVETNDMHNVKPWFTGKLDFVPPVNFVGDGEFQLRGGSLAIFQGHKAAAFVYQHRLHTITLLVHADAAARPHTESTSRGFHVISWASGGFGMALVSDIDWDSLHQLEARLGSASGEKE